MEADFPQKNKYRAKRRALMNKTKDKARDLIKIFHWGPDSVKLAEHLQFCDKNCCHNPRHGNSKHDKTLQERKADEDEDQEI